MSVPRGLGDDPQHEDQLNVPGGFGDDPESDDQDLINNQLLNSDRQDETIRDYIGELRKPQSKPRQKPEIIPTAASSRPMRNRTGDPNKKRLQFPSSLEDNYQYAKYADFDDRTQEFITT